MKQNWEAQHAARYQMREVVWYVQTWNIITATVTVENGKVVAATDAQAYNGASVPNPDLSQFKSVEDLFALLLDLTETGQYLADILAVRFDDSRSFPSWVTVDQFATASDDEQKYAITDLTILP
jgi:hypothetical protein